MLSPTGATMEDHVSPSPSRARALALVAILAASALVVVLDLARQPADPPRNLSASLGTLDEGLWSHNAVDGALFGRSRRDDLNPMYVTSAPLLIRASYEVFGVGIVATRIPSIALGALTVLLAGVLWLRRDPVAAVAGSVLLATTYLFLAYSRLGLLETPAAGLAIAGVACTLFALQRANLWIGVAGGALLAAAVTAKVQIAGAVLGVAAGLALWAILERRPRAGRVLAAAACGFAVVGAAWIAWVGTHLDPAARAEWAWHSSGLSLGIGTFSANASRFLGSSDGFGTYARPLLIAAAIGLVLQIAAWAIKRERPRPVQFAAAGWAAGALVALTALSSRPSRYAVLALPGLALTSAGGVAALRALAGRLLRITVACVALAGVALAAIPGLHSWFTWSPEWSVQQTAQLLERDTRPGDVIFGGYAFIPATQAHREVIVFHPPSINAHCPIERYGADFVLIARNDATMRNFLLHTYPGLLVRANLLARPSMLGHPLDFYRIPASLAPGRGCASEPPRA